MKDKFEVGDRVARFSSSRNYPRRPGEFTEDRIAKIYKTGKIILESDPKKQYAPYNYSNRIAARQTKDEYHSSGFYLWGEEIDKEISDTAAKSDRQTRYLKIKEKIVNIDKYSSRWDIDEELLQGLEALFTEKGEKS